MKGSQYRKENKEVLFSLGNRVSQSTAKRRQLQISHELCFLIQRVTRRVAFSPGKPFSHKKPCLQWEGREGKQAREGRKRQEGREGREGRD